MKPLSDSSVNNMCCINPYARVLGPAVGALAEFSIFYGVDTCAKRLMAHEGRVLNPNQSLQETKLALRNIIFGEAVNASFLQKIKSLYPGIGFGLAYKVSQRVYKFGGQPLLKKVIHNSSYASFVRNIFGKKHERVIVETTAGALISAGEIMLAPLDILKIKMQTNPDSIRNTGLGNIIMKHKSGLFVGAPWLISRNFIGGSALFGGSAAMKEYVLDIKENEKPAFSKLILASAGGSFASIIVSSPLDVVKTRVQRAPFDQPITGRQVVADILKHEGPGAFMKGIIPKTLTVGPKIMCTYTLAQYLTHVFSDMFEPTPAKSL